MTVQSTIRTERVRAEQMDGSVAHAMLDSSPECVKLLDPEGRLRFMSENGLALMQIPDYAKVDGACWWDLWPEASRPTLRDAVASANRGVAISFEAECPTAAGVHRHWRVRVSQVSSGSLDRMILASSEDITDIVREREARERLDRDNEALRRFTRLVAHDLRSPVRHLKVLSDLVIEESGEEADLADTLPVLEQIGSAADTLLELMNGLESLHDCAFDDTAPAPLDLRETIARAHALVAGPDGDIALSIDGDARVLGSVGLFVAVFRNLLENSLKYHAGTAACAVRVSLRDGPADTLEIVVHDNGPGFADDRLDEVFMPLVRQSNSAGKPGSGIGLSMVQSVIEKHGGEVGVQAVDSGAAIRIVLPALARNTSTTEKVRS